MTKDAFLASYARPLLDPVARYGLVGEVVDGLEPYSEADPAGLTLDFLVTFGHLVGPEPYAVAGAARHPARLFELSAGRTSRSRKGTSRSDIDSVVSQAWGLRQSIRSGLSTGEGLVKALDEVPENRLLVFEPEFARTLRVCKRRGNTLPDLLRAAWDTGDLSVMTRQDPLEVHNAHLSVIGHITEAELVKLVDETDIMSGFLNRFLIVVVDRSKKLPEGTPPPQDLVKVLAERVIAAVDSAWRRSDWDRWQGVRRTPEAKELWNDIYYGLDDDADGLFGAATARAEAQLLRLSLTYALTDGSHVIDRPHLEAAQALWAYCEASARYLFDRSKPDHRLERVEQLGLKAGESGITRTSINNAFSRHLSKDDLDELLFQLVEAGRLIPVTSTTGGRSLTTYYHPTTKTAQRAKEAKEANPATESPEA